MKHIAEQLNLFPEWELEQLGLKMGDKYYLDKSNNLMENMEEFLEKSTVLEEIHLAWMEKQKHYL